MESYTEYCQEFIDEYYVHLASIDHPSESLSTFIHLLKYRSSHNLPLASEAFHASVTVATNPLCLVIVKSKISGAVQAIYKVHCDEKII